MTIKTSDIRPGDVVRFADQRDLVIATSYTAEEKISRIDAIRAFTDGRDEQPRAVFFYAGNDSVQDVESRGGLDSVRALFVDLSD